MIPFGGVLLGAGLIMALAVADRFDGIDVTVAGWIVAGVGVILILAGLFTQTGGRRSREPRERESRERRDTRRP